MILHSVAPLPWLLPPEEGAPPETVQVGGTTLAGHRSPKGFVVSQVLSTDPRRFLEARFAPGSVLETPPAPARGTPPGCGEF